MSKGFGETRARLAGQAIGLPLATLAALKDIAAEDRYEGMKVLVTALPYLGGGEWRFMGASALTGDDALVCAPNVGSGRWLRVTGAVDLGLPFSFATADAAALLTMQAGSVLAVERVLWHVTADFTGGASSAIGVSSNKATPTNWTTKGDVLGGATGDVLATLVASVGRVAGTIGTDMDTLAKVRGLILIPTDALRFDRITSVFTAGTGFVRVVGNLLENAGA